jgi:hypothetical protein
MSRIVAFNVVALTRLTFAAAPAFVARGSGTVINIASVVAVAPETLNVVYGGSKAFVLAFSRSLRHELADKGVRVQVVLPGAAATDFWSVAGSSVERLPREIVMPAGDMADAALAGLDQGEFATVPSLPDPADWDAYEATRRALLPGLSRATPASRYGITPGAVAACRNGGGGSGIEGKCGDDRQPLPNSIVTLAHDSARPITRQYYVGPSTVSGMMKLSWSRGPAGRIGDMLRSDGRRPQAAGGKSA